MKTTRSILAAAVAMVLSLGLVKSAQAGPDQMPVRQVRTVVLENGRVVHHHYYSINYNHPLTDGYTYLKAPVEYTGHFHPLLYPWELVVYYPRYKKTGNPWGVSWVPGAME